MLLTDCPRNRAVENRALYGRAVFAEMLHDERTVSKHVHVFAQVEQTDVLQMKALFVGGGRTAE